jgi:hypothetical protein
VNRAWAVLGLGGCVQPFITRVADDQPCLEAGYAIARRTEECTGDLERANDRFHQFERQWTCIPTPPDDPDLWDVAPDLYACAATISSLSCDAVDELGDDLSRWLGVDPGCGWVVEPNP